jgi:succinate dehydrogenase / fumarate reductase, membrane anchor subunit
MATIARQAPRAIPRNTWGTISWLFMRFSALALIFLVLGHFAIQHVINDVHNLDLAFVQQRWTGPGWRIYDALMLSLALVHGLNGLRIVADDYILDARRNKVARWAIVVIGAALIVVGMVAVIGGVRRP